MRAVVCTQAIISRFTKNAARMRAPMSWELLPSGACHGIIEKGSSRQQKFAADNYHSRENRQQALGLSSLLLIVTVFVFFVFMIDTAWNATHQGFFSLESSASSRLERQTGRVLQSRSISPEVDWEARQKAGALQGMGITFRTGTRVMTELIIAHLAEETTAEELRMFLRTLHRSGATARADVVLLFPWSLTSEITRVIDEEDRSFQELILERQATAPPHTKKVPKQSDGGEPEKGRAQDSVAETTNQQQLSAFPSANFTISPFNAKAFWKSREERKASRGDMVWDNSTVNEISDIMAAVDWADWGSIVGFEMQDLDQDEVLKGFIEDPPAQIRRWICYQLLLGMMKSRYRIVLLTEVRGVFILRDVLAAARKKAFGQGINLYGKNLSWEDVHEARKERLERLSAEGNMDGSSSTSLQNQVTSGTSMANRKMGSSQKPDLDAGIVPKGSEKAKDQAGRLERHFIEEVYGNDVWKFLDKEDKGRATLSSGFILGTMKPMRHFSSAILTEIASLALKRKNRRPFHDEAVLNHLVQKSSVLTRKATGKLHLLSNNDAPIHSLPGSRQGSFFFREDGHGFAALTGLNEELMADDKRAAIVQSIRDEICSSRADSWAYRDCSFEGSVAVG
ncbi:unnamed protein product [Calypogeia fissa]